MLSVQFGRKTEAIAAYRRAIDAGNDDAWLYLGGLFAKEPGLSHHAEEAYRQAIAAGVDRGWLSLGALLSRQRGREDEAISAFRAAITHGDLNGEAQHALACVESQRRHRASFSSAPRSRASA